MVSSLYRPTLGYLDILSTTQIATGDTIAFQQLVDCSPRHDMTAMHTGSRADVEHIVGTHNHISIVLHHDDAVAQIA